MINSYYTALLPGILATGQAVNRRTDLSKIEEYHITLCYLLFLTCQSVAVDCRTSVPTYRPRWTLENQYLELHGQHPEVMVNFRKTAVRAVMFDEPLQHPASPVCLEAPQK